jgi:nucleoside 2-deoxyribosyltransferase
MKLSDFHPMTAVYVASPYTFGDKLVNVQRQIDAGDELIALGFCAVVPLLSHYQEEQGKGFAWEDWMRQSIEKLRRCDVLLRLEGYSEGADLEEEFAYATSIPVVYEIENLIALEVKSYLTSMAPSVEWMVSYRKEHLVCQVSFWHDTWAFESRHSIKHVDEMPVLASQIFTAYQREVKTRV